MGQTFPDISIERRSVIVFSLGEMYDELEMQERYYKSVRRIAYEEGYSEGEAETVKKVSEKLLKMGMSEEQITEIISS